MKFVVRVNNKYLVQVESTSNGDAENGMCAPEIGFSRKWPDIGENFYGRNV